MPFLPDDAGAESLAPAIVGHELEQHRLAVKVACVEIVDGCGRVDLAAIAPAVTPQDAKGFIAESNHGLALRAVVGAAPGAEQVATRTAAARYIDRVRRANRHHTADGRAPVQGRSGAMQDFDVLDQSRIDKVAGSVRETASIKLVGQRYAIDEHRNAIAADAANVDSLGTEARAGGLVVDARNVAEDVSDRRGELIAEFRTRQDRDVGRDLAHRTLVLIGNYNDPVEWGPGLRGLIGRGRGCHPQHCARE